MLRHFLLQRMLLYHVFLSVIAVTVSPNPIGRSIMDLLNEIDHGTSRDKSSSESERNEEEISSLPANNESVFQTAAKEIESTVSTVDNLLPETVTRTSEEKLTTKANPFSWILAPLVQRVQFSPQSFFQDRLTQLKEALNNWSTASGRPPNGTSKQFGNVNGLLHVTGLNDPGFYTNRLESAGFLGGNGWFANKGGILGGPGALVSTGSLLTDYPSAYRK